MNIFSFIIILEVLHILLIEKERTKIYIRMLSLAIVTELCIDIGYFVKVGNMDFSYSEILICLVFVLTILFCKKVKIKVIIGASIVLTITIMGLVLAFLYPYKGYVYPTEIMWDNYYFNGVEPAYLSLSFHNLKELVHLSIFLIISLAIFSWFRQENWKLLLSSCINYFKIVLVFSSFEFILVKLFHQYSLLKNITIKFLGNKYILNDTLMAGRLHGLKSEPSYYAYMLMVMALAIVAGYIWQLCSKQWVYYTLFFIVVSSSFTTVIVALYLGVVFYIFYWNSVSINKSQNALLLPIFLIAMIILIAMMVFGLGLNINNYYYNRLISFTKVLSNLNINGWEGDAAYLIIDASSRIRFVSILGAFKQMMNRPILGLGLGTTYSHGSMATIFANLGIVGTLVWGKYIFFSIKGANKIYGFYVVTWFIINIIITNGLFTLYGVQNLLIIISLFVLSKSLDANKKIMLSSG